MIPALFNMVDNFAKPFKNYNEQIEILNSRGMIIEDVEHAKRVLQKNNYYRLINGYKKPFEDRTDLFSKDTKFTDIVLLYDFDKSFCVDIFRYILEIESVLKSIIAYRFTEKHGSCGYNKIENFGTSKQDIKTANEFFKILENIKTEATKKTNEKNCKYFAYNHYLKEYNDVPLWVMMETLTFGNIKYLYSCMQHDDKKSIANDVSDISNIYFSTKDLELCLYILVNARNQCAHKGRIYNFEQRISVCETNCLLKKVLIRYPELKTNNSASFLIVLSSLLKQPGWSDVLIKLANQFRVLQKSLSPKAINKIDSSMGYDFVLLIDALMQEI